MSDQVRNFRILNANNQYIDLLSLDSFARNPDGLGLDIETSFYQSFNSYSEVAKASKQAEMKFDIIFGYISKKAYLKYNQVLLFLNVGGLKLEYTVPDVGVFIRDVTVSSLTKTEKDEYNVLQETLTLQGLTPWYSWIQLTQAFDPVINAGIIYDDSVGLKYDHKAYAWSADGATRFTRRFPNLNLLKGTNVTGTFHGKGSPLPSGWGKGAGASVAEVINVYDHPLITAGVQITTAAAPTAQTGVRINYDNNGVYSRGDKYVQSFYVRNDGATDFTIIDQMITYYTDGTSVRMTNTDGSADDIWTVPADGAWHLYRGHAKIIPDASSIDDIDYIRMYCYSDSRANTVANSKFTVGLPKFEINDVATPWIPALSEITDKDYPTYVGEMMSTEYNDSEDKTQYMWTPGTSPMKDDTNHADLDKAYIHSAFSWSADGTKGFCTTLPNDNLWNEAKITTGYVVTANGSINSSGVTANHQTMTDIETLNPGVTDLTYTIYNPGKKKQTNTNTNRVGCFDNSGKFISAVSLPLISGDEVQTTVLHLPANTRKVRLGVIHGFGTEKDTTLKFKFEEGNVATPYTPYWGSTSLPNMLLATSGKTLTFKGPTDTVSTDKFKIFDGTFFDHFKVGDKIIVSADFTTADTTGAKGTVQARIQGSAGSEFQAYDTANYGNGRFIFSHTLTQQDLAHDSIEFIAKGLKSTTTITVKNIKMERETGISLYRKALSEDSNTDMPCYIGRYAKSEDTGADSAVPTMYKWDLMPDLDFDKINNTIYGKRLDNMVNYVGTKQFKAQSGTNVTSSLKVPFANGKTFGEQKFEANGTLVVSFDWEVVDQSGPTGHFNPQLTQKPWAIGDQLYKPVYPSANKLSGRYSQGCILDAAMLAETDNNGIDFAFRMDNMKDTSTIIISDFSVEYFPPNINYFHYAFAWSADGSERFTSSFPRPNLISNTRLSGGQAQATDTGIEFVFDNDLTLAEQDINVGDWLVISFDYSATDTANHFSGRFIPTFDLAPGFGGNTEYVQLSTTNQSGHYSVPLKITDEFVPNGFATKMKLIYESMDSSVTVTIKNFKMEVIQAKDQGYTLKNTEWMPGQSEVQDSDYPGFVGTYTDDIPTDSSDHTKYTWAALTDIADELGDQTIGDLVTPDGVISPYRIVYNDTTVYQADYSKSASFLILHNDSLYFGTQTDSSLRITIKATQETGALVNPSWYLTDTSGNTIQTEGFLTTIPVGFDLVVSSDSFERKMIIRDPSGELPDKDIDDLINPSATGWIRVPIGDSRIVLSPELYTATGGFNGGRIQVEFKKEWLVV